ncbi:sugar MFS transporter [Cellulomonas sp. PS-H5]|uniref:MFS transporter n=1 Tax=Cellulomonas sp. PS-H5 TaxID=2820400 RepID=UPI001C4F936A|nr:MFS transporter [Cellulomonas sp. PS-H5]MBW0253194.1 MFS transporter [Cellulomonas sp. PS-H5]
MTTQTPAPAPRLYRDRFTLTLDGVFVTWGWLLYSFNPSVPLLAAELGVSNAQAGLHGTAMAVGAVLAAALTPWTVLRLGRRAALVGAGVLIAVGIGLLTSGWTLPATLSGMVVVSVGGNVAVSAAQAGLVLHHGRTASAAVTEANGVGSGIGLLGPLAVGACVAAGWGWRPAVAVTAALALATAVAVRLLPEEGALGRPRRVPEPATARASRPPGAAPRPASRLGVPGPGTSRPERPASSAAAPGPASPDLSRDPGAAEVRARADQRDSRSGAAAAGRAVLASRWFLVAVVAALALENATTYWATDLVRDRTGAGAGIATATTAGLVAGMTLIRFVVGPLSLRVSPARLLAASFGVAVAGWAVLWTATSAAVALAGLFLAGLGYGAQYPLGIALLLGAAGGATDAAQARATVGGGVAVGLAPFLLGALADAVGSHTAFLVVPVLAVVGGVAAVAGGRAWRRERLGVPVAAGEPA